MIPVRIYLRVQSLRNIVLSRRIKRDNKTEYASVKYLIKMGDSFKTWFKAYFIPRNHEELVRFSVKSSNSLNTYTERLHQSYENTFAISHT